LQLPGTAVTIAAVIVDLGVKLKQLNNINPDITFDG